MLDLTEVKKGMILEIDNEPFEVLEARFIKLQKQRPNLQTKLKNLITGKVVDRTFHPSDEIKEAEIERIQVKFLYSHRGEYWFCEADDPSKRFKLDEKILGNKKNFLKKDLIVTALKFNDRIINISLPLKMNFKVMEAPPGIKGDTEQSTSKFVIIETGAQVKVPLFINEGDIICLNTETGEYVERVEKSTH